MAATRDFKGDLKHDGYSLEEKYFYDLNRKLIQRLKEKRKRDPRKRKEKGDFQPKEPPMPPEDRAGPPM
jgi:hypothetical protein